jgi:ATP/ADP translocase
MKLGLSSILTIIFVIAKLMKVIGWSWWLVFAPTIVSLSLLFSVMGATLIFAVLLAYGERKGHLPNGTLERAAKALKGSR